MLPLIGAEKCSDKRAFGALPATGPGMDIKFTVESCCMPGARGLLGVMNAWANMKGHVGSDACFMRQ